MRERTSYRMRLDVSPSEQAFEILNCVQTFGRDRLMLLAHSGSHTLNPYHNVIHEMQNVYYSWSCYMNESDKGGGPGIQELIQASLFHDHNHSGGILSDDKNVARALDFVERELNAKSDVQGIINCTQFVNGKFPIEPTNLAQRCIRDADLMTIYSQEGFNLTLGLFEEMARKPLSAFSEDEIREAISKTENFLWAQTMYTDHGKRMQEEHLVGQLAKFEEFAYRRFEYKQYLRREEEATAA